MELYILAKGEQIAASIVSDKPMPSPWIPTGLDAHPIAPNAEQGTRYEMAYRNGKIIWDAVKDDYTEAEPTYEEPPAPTREEVEAARAAAYRATVDPITCEIQRLRDMGGTAEEIAEAEARREAAVAAIKAQWPYPEGAQ